MNKEQQDKLWNDLSAETQQEYREKYEFHLADSKREMACSDGGYDLTVIRSQTIVEELVNMFGEENLHPKPPTYADVANRLFKKGAWQPEDYDHLGFDKNANPTYDFNCTSKVHIEKLIAINKLLNVAKYLNGDWKPDWSHTEEKWAIGVDHDNNLVKIVRVFGNDRFNCHLVYFRTKELAKQAVQILGEETIRLALTTDY